MPRVTLQKTFVRCGENRKRKTANRNAPVASAHGFLRGDGSSPDDYGKNIFAENKETSCGGCDIQHFKNTSAGICRG